MLMFACRIVVLAIKHTILRECLFSKNCGILPWVNFIHINTRCLCYIVILLFFFVVLIALLINCIIGSLDVFR